MGSIAQENVPPTRSYQQEMLDASLKQNVVIALDTGSGKTHIAVLRMKIECEREPNKRSWFIAPTVGLCEQQQNVISSCLPVPVGLISGALQPDQWTDPKLWRQALSTHRIIVSTPQVLLDALRHGYVNLGRDIGLLVFDEAHHAADKHPYNMIMREFYDACSPRAAPETSSGNVRPFILGLTASPVFGAKNIDKAFQKIEKNLDSIIIAPRENREELGKHIHRPVFKKILYQALSYKTDWIQSANIVALAEVVKSLDIQQDPTIISLRRQLTSTTDPKKLGRIDQRLSQAIDKGDTFVHKGMHDFLRIAKELCIDIGPWAGDWYVYNVINKALRSDAHEVYLQFPDRHQNEKAYLVKSLQRIKANKVDYDTQTIARGCSPKTNDFIAYLQQEKREVEARDEVFSGIVFITRRDGALALSELLNHHPYTSTSYSVGTLVGSSESNKRNAFLGITRSLLPEKQNTVLAGFRVGEKNLVVSTAVAEEGIDIQACCSVFRWDLPQNMVSWTQSRGRARRKKSSFILMFEDGGTHEQQIRTWEESEREMIRKYNEDRQRHGAQATKEKNDDDDENLETKVASTGAKVTLQSAISHVAHFCNTLRSIFQDDVQPVYDISPPDYPQGYHAVLQSQVLKRPLPEDMGPYGASLTLPRLIPPALRIYRVGNNYSSKKAARRHVAYKAYVALYEAGLLDERLLPLSTAITPLREMEVQALLRDVEDREGPANVRQQLDPWMAMLVGEHNGSNPEEWWLSELAIEGLETSRMFTRCKMPELDFSPDVLYDPNDGPRKFSIRPVGSVSLSIYEVTAARHYTRMLFSALYGSRLRWDDLEFSYLFLPLSADVSRNDLWEERRAWAEGVRSQDHDLTARDRIAISASQFSTRYNNPSDVSLLINNHTFYLFKRWRHERLRQDEEEALRKKYSRIRDLEISYPVIEARPLQARMNFLLPSQKAKQPSENVILLPEITEVALVSRKDTILGLLLPSILRAMVIKLIAYHFQNSLEELSPVLRQIPLDLIQTALMTPAVNAHFNYERFECLGDSVLKLITCVQLLADHPTWPEGFLAKYKDVTVSNALLAKAALGKGLYRWIIRRAFATRKWVPDYARTCGQQSTDVLCDAADDCDEGCAQLEPGEPNSEEMGANRNGSDNLLVQLSMKTLADVVESLIGAAFLSGGWDRSIACIQAFSIDIGRPWKPLSESIGEIVASTSSLTKPIPEVANSEAILGYTFKNKLLLVEALMHMSSQSDIQSVSYERMAFVGDAVIDAIIIEALYRAEERGKIFGPGEMQFRKAALVNMHFLGFVCLGATIEVDSSLPRWDPALKQAVLAMDQHTVGLAHCLIHSSSPIFTDLQDALIRFERDRAKIEAELEHGRAFPWTTLARLQVPKFLGDIVKSTLGAIYLDSKGDMTIVNDVLKRIGVMKVLRRLIHEDIDTSHPVSRVWEWAAKHQKADSLEYKMVQRYGNITCTLILEGVEVKALTERYNGKASEDDIRFRVAEASLPLLIETYGTK